MSLIDELTVTLRIGQKYTFIGIVRRDSYSDKMITAIEVPRSPLHENFHFSFPLCVPVCLCKFLFTCRLTVLLR